MIAIAAATFVATFLGGLFALRFSDKLHLLLGFSAGAIVGVAFFDLLPEALEQGEKLGEGGRELILKLTALGFVAYLLLDRLMGGRARSDHHDGLDHGHAHGRAQLRRGLVGAGSLSTHSFLDGLAIGVAFQASAAIGAIVALAVIAHDASDGMNTVNVVLRNGGSRRTAFKWLLADAVAPVLGIAAAATFTIPEGTLGPVLALFAGFFIYLGASDLVPESYHSHPKWATSLATIAGLALIYAVIQVAHI